MTLSTSGDYIHTLSIIHLYLHLRILIYYIPTSSSLSLYENLCPEVIDSVELILCYSVLTREFLHRKNTSRRFILFLLDQDIYKG